MLLQINSKQIRDNAIITQLIADANVTNAKLASGIDAAKIADGSVSNTEFQYIGGLTSDAQTQLTSNASAISAEVTRAEAAEGVLQDNIDAEAVTRAAADAAITSDLASTASGKGASLVGVEDAGSIFTATTVEGVLAELKGDIDSLTTSENSAIAAETTRAEAAEADLAADIATLAGGDLEAKVNRSGDTMTGPLLMSTGTVAGDAALQVPTKGYVDGLVSGLLIKTSVRVATTTALPTNTLADGSDGAHPGVGATLTADANGAFPTVDGITLLVGDRILVKDEPAIVGRGDTAGSSANGVFEVTDLGSVGTPWVLTRTSDFDDSPEGEVVDGSFVFVGEGTINGDNGWVQTDNSPVSVNSASDSQLVFTQFSGAGQIIAGAAISKTGNQLDVNTDNVTIEVNGSDQLRIKDAGVTNAKVATGIDAAKIADGSVSNTEFQYINSVTSNVQTQLDTNASAISTETSRAEAAEAQISSDLASTATGKGASLVGVEDALGSFTATDVEGVLAELYVDITSASSTSSAAISDLQAAVGSTTGTAGLNYSANNYVTDATSLETAIGALDAALKTDADNLAAHLADTTDAHDASAISFDNTTSGLTATDVQAAIDEVEGRLDTAESDITSEIARATAAESALDTAKVDRAGDTMTGNLNLTGASTSVNIEGASGQLNVGGTAPGDGVASVEPTRIGVRAAGNQNTLIDADVITLNLDGTSGNRTTIQGGGLSTFNGGVEVYGGGLVTISGTGGASHFKVQGSSGNFFDANNADNSLGLGLSGATTSVRGDLSVAGDLTVSGTTTHVNSTTVDIGDANLELNHGITTNAANSNGGITIKRLDTDNTTRIDAVSQWNETSDKWEVGILGDMSAVARYAELSSTSSGLGASTIGIQDVGTYYTATDVEGALQEIGTSLGGGSGLGSRVSALEGIMAITAGDTVADMTYTSTNYVSVGDTLEVAIGSLDAQLFTTTSDLATEITDRTNADSLIRSDLASTANALGASLVGIEDAGTYFTSTTVEGALAELAAAGALVGNHPGYDEHLVTSGDETANASAAFDVTLSNATVTAGQFIQVFINGQLQAFDDTTNSAYAAYTKPNTTTIRIKQALLLAGDVIQIRYSY